MIADQRLEPRYRVQILWCCSGTLAGTIALETLILEIQECLVVAKSVLKGGFQRMQVLCSFSLFSSDLLPEFPLLKPGVLELEPSLVDSSLHLCDFLLLCF